MSTIHTYRGWKVTAPVLAAPVHFTDQQSALLYFVKVPAAAELDMTLTEITCGLDRGRRFCSHCTNCSFTRNV